MILVPVFINRQLLVFSFFLLFYQWQYIDIEQVCIMGVECSFSSRCTL